MTYNIADERWQAAREEAAWRDRAWHEPRQRYSDSAPPQPRVTWQQWRATAPTKRLTACAVTGCGRDGLAYVNHRASVCLDCLRALRAHKNGG